MTAINLAGVDANNAAFSMVDSNDTSAAFDKVQIGDTLDNDTDSAATIYLDNARAGTYKIFDNIDLTGNDPGNGLVFGDKEINSNQVLADSNIGEYWNYNYGTMVFSSGLLKGEWEVAAGDSNSDLLLYVSRNDKAVQDVFTGISGGMAALVDQVYSVGTNLDNAGIQFVSRVTSSSFVPKRSDAAAILEGAAQAAVAGGAPQLTGNVMGKVSSLMVNHNDTLWAAPSPPLAANPAAWALWFTPFYGTGDVDGLSAGRFQVGSDYNYGGAALGLDYNISEALRLGLALNLGGGSSDSNGDFSKTENDFDFFGASLYGAYSHGAWGLSADLGFTGVDSDITQNLPAALGLGSALKSEVESNAFTLGLTGKYRFAATETLNIAPHLGLRYTKISTDDADVKLAGGGKVFETTVEDQNLFQIPLGVEFSGTNVTEGGWRITPKADLGVLFTLGDTDVDSRARLAGTGFRTGTMNAEVADSAAFTGALGITAAADNGLSLGLDYHILAGGHQTDHQFSGTLRFEF